MYKEPYFPESSRKALEMPKKSPSSTLGPSTSRGPTSFIALPRIRSNPLRTRGSWKIENLSPILRGLGHDFVSLVCLWESLETQQNQGNQAGGSFAGKNHGQGGNYRSLPSAVGGLLAPQLPPWRISGAHFWGCSGASALLAAGSCIFSSL